MQTHLAPEYQNTADGQEAEAILRKCVHCGFCTATCPTYQLLGDELDGPRGRIYLIKQVLEGQTPSPATQMHLDRCLTCRNCESTCPSGVEYGQLVEIGRKLVDAKVPRPPMARAVRWLLKEGLSSPLFGTAMRAGQMVRPLLPATLQNKVPARQTAPVWPTGRHARKVLMLAGCVQPSMAPGIGAATARVLDAASIQGVLAGAAGCCGAVKLHLSDHHGALEQMRANIDAWWPYIEPATGPGIEAIAIDASGCGATVKDYGRLLGTDPEYAGKAARVSALARDLSELLPDWVERLKGRISATARPRLVFHPPCSLQHAQQLRGQVERHLAELGFEIRLAAAESHLCCGSAGTYSVLQPELAYALRDRKLGNLAVQADEIIVSANVGCISHLQSGTPTAVRHWVEVLADSLTPA